MYPVDDLVSHIRDHVLRDTPQPWLFDDAVIIRFINEGYKLLARHTHFQIDDSIIYTVSGIKAYSLPKRCIYLREVVDDQGCYLTPFTRRAKPRVWSGRPSAYSTDVAHSKLKLVPIPDDQYQLSIVYAEVPETVSAGDDLLIPDDWALALGDYVAYRALRNNDSDGSATVPAEGFFVTWREFVRDAKAQVTREAMGADASAQPRAWV